MKEENMTQESNITVEAKFKVKFEYTIFYDKNTKVYVSECNFVDRPFYITHRIMSQGKTKKEARQAIKDAVISYIKVVIAKDNKYGNGESIVVATKLY